MMRAMPQHANFAEYAPITLLWPLWAFKVGQFGHCALLEFCLWLSGFFMLRDQFITGPWKIFPCDGHGRHLHNHCCFSALVAQRLFDCAVKSHIFIETNPLSHKHIGWMTDWLVIRIDWFQIKQVLLCLACVPKWNGVAIEKYSMHTCQRHRQVKLSWRWYAVASWKPGAIQSDHLPQFRLTSSPWLAADIKFPAVLPRVFTMMNADTRCNTDHCGSSQKLID